MRYNKLKDIYHITLFGRNDTNRDQYGNPLTTSIKSEQIALITTPYITSLYSQYNNSRLYRFNLNHKFKNLARGSKVMITYARIPGLTYSSIYRCIRLAGSEGTNFFDTERGFSSNPIIALIGEGGTIDTNFYNNDPTFSGLEVPPNFLSKGYIELELSTIATGHIAFAQGEIDDLCISFIIYEPEEEQTSDVNIAPEVDLDSLKRQNRPPKY